MAQAVPEPITFLGIQLMTYAVIFFIASILMFAIPLVIIGMTAPETVDVEDPGSVLSNSMTMWINLFLILLGMVIALVKAFVFIFIGKGIFEAFLSNQDIGTLMLRVGDAIAYASYKVSTGIWLSLDVFFFNSDINAVYNFITEAFDWTSYVIG